MTVSRKSKYSDEQVKEAVRHSTSYLGVLRYLGMISAGGSHAHMKKRIHKMGIDTNHFTGRGWSKNKPGPKKNHKEVLIKHSADRLNRTSRSTLLRCMIDYGFEYICEVCQNTGNWCGKDLVLHIEHKDGDFRNDTPENLAFLCPNCHSQTDTYCRPKTRKISYDGEVEIQYSVPVKSNKYSSTLSTIRMVGTTLCGICKISIKRGQYLCLSCFNKYKRKANGFKQKTKIDWPLDSDLIDMVKSTSYLATSKVLGVSDNAIRKRLKSRGYDLKTFKKCGTI